ncbi:hypothetical protein PMAYCL1PPCAC_03192, partial [Pristionchus mayeri]
SAQMLNDYLVVIVCPTNALVIEVYERLKASGEGTVAICESALGVLKESTKTPSGTFIACTTSVCFEGWTFISQSRKNIRVIVCHHRSDNAALEIAHDLVHPMSIDSYTVYNNDIERLNGYNSGRDNTTSLFQSVKSIFTELSPADPGVLLDSYRKENDINDLLDAKRLLHRRLRHLIISAKVVCARVLTRKMMTADSPMDISCQGFVDRS